MNLFKPMLLTSLKSYDQSQFAKDVTAGIIVAIIALPLSIALALASGVGPQAGIFTAIVAGFVISAFGGSSVQIAGPTAAFLNPDGNLSFWKPDQIYSLYDHNRFYFWNRCYDRYRTVKRFLWCHLSKWTKTD